MRPDEDPSDHAPAYVIVYAVLALLLLCVGVGIGFALAWLLS